MIVRNIQKVLDFVDSVLLPQKEDIFSDYLWKRQISDGDKAFEIMLKPKKDSLRIGNPLELNANTSHCFCDFVKSSSTRITIYELNDSFNVFAFGNQPKLVLATKECGPEPKPEHFEMILRVTRALTRYKFLNVCNIWGSGASIPQHWHSQFVLMRESLETLYANIKCNNSLSPHPAVKEIYQPVWGIQIDFQDRDPSEVAQILYEAVQILRLRAQLKLSYNLYIESSQPNLVSIVFRETWNECPFQTAEVLAMIARIVDKETSEKIAKSDNQFWKWAWLELIGGLPARDESFNDGKFSHQFWSKLYRFIELQERYRSGVWNHVVSCLSCSL